MDPEEEKETMSVGSVKLGVYKRYFSSIDSVPTIIFMIVLFVLGQIATSGLDFFVAKWVNWEESMSQKNTSNITIEGLSQNDTEIAIKNTINNIRNQYLITYSVLAVAFVYLVTHRNIVFFIQLCLNASINLHDKLFRGITRAQMVFFNNNPSGRILNRFSKDIGNIDSFLPNIMIDSICVS